MSLLRESMSTHEPVWDEQHGYYMPGEAEGALPNGTRVIKVASQPEDATPEGTPGIVVSSIDARWIPEEKRRYGSQVADYFYFVLWDNFPYYVGVMDLKVKGE